MKAIMRMVMQEVRAGIRNRLVLATTLVLAALAVSIVFLGSAPVGVVDADPVSLTVVSLASLTIFLVPLLALMLSFDTVVGEAERALIEDALAALAASLENNYDPGSHFQDLDATAHD